MAMHGISHAAIGVPDLAMARDFYLEFGLTETAHGKFGTAAGGDQLIATEGDRRGIYELGFAVDDRDDLEQLASRLARLGLPCRYDGSGRLVFKEPVTNLPLVARVMDRPAPVVKGQHLVNRRADAVYRGRQPTVPRRLAHVVIGSPAWEQTRDFFQELGLFVTDERGKFISFLSCGQDHHNVAVVNAPRLYLHHTSWEVDDVDDVLKGGAHLTAGDSGRNLYGPGRHFIGSNYFWYFRDPAGLFMEYMSDMDIINDVRQWWKATRDDLVPGGDAWGPLWKSGSFTELRDATDMIGFEA